MILSFLSIETLRRSGRREAFWQLVGREGFEPSLTGPEPAVLPLDDLPMCEGNVTQHA